MPTLNWIGKEAVVKHHQDVPFRLLEPVSELSLPSPRGKEAGELSLPSPLGRGVGGEGNFGGNLIVQGDNLHALKALLPRYAGQVKCIYIDPPYNTGNEGWVYNDNVNSPEIRKWLGEVVGKEGETLDRHDRWLCMMYPRLVLLRQFLREDGVILMSLDSNEQRHAELLLDEIFGAANRIETFIWKKSYGGGAKSKQVVNLHEYVLCFARNKERVGEIELPPSDEVKRYYKFQDEKLEIRGPFRLQPLATNSMDARPNLRYAIPYQGEEIWPEKQWQWAKERALAALEANELVIKKVRERWSVNYKQYLRDSDGDERGSKLYSIIESIYTQQGTNELKGMFGDGKTFEFPKPPTLVEKFIQAFTHRESIVLDSFAGSGTTGHAVLSANAKDGGNRRFILVEMDPNIAENVTAERIKRVAGGYAKGALTPDPSPKGRGDKSVEGLGGGFQFCRLSAEPLFDADGQIRPDVTFAQLAEFVWFAETGTGFPHPGPLPAGEGRTLSPLLGVHDGRAIYLLYNGVLKDPSVAGGNVLTGAVFDRLPQFAGPKVIYAAANRMGARAGREGITFKQTPYALEV
ncbi:MAG: site-specific DNA-methyltransferase [Candidatus Contendobacter sp.]|nr:site-specific DNA-methyltransferase [Candidatus Contendobacter sp.]MDG4559044.1 site-specific DNA-methyltransferase [Candidatus Contendobacter sp.]